MLVNVLLALTVIMITARLVGCCSSPFQSAGRDRRGRRRHPARPSLLGRICARSRGVPAAARCRAVSRRHRAARRHPLHVPGRPRARPAACCARAVSITIAISHASIVVPFALGAALASALFESLRAGRRAVLVVRAVPRRVDVDHRVPGARAHPRRSRAAADADGHARADLRRDQRRDRVVPARVRRQRDASDAGRGDSHRRR